jgi:hypothetical protein
LNAIVILLFISRQAPVAGLNHLYNNLQAIWLRGFVSPPVEGFDTSRAAEGKAFLPLIYRQKSQFYERYIPNSDYQQLTGIVIFNFGDSDQSNQKMTDCSDDGLIG